MINWFLSIPSHYRVALLPGVASLIGTFIITWRGLIAEGIHPGFADKDFANYWMAGKLILADKTADLFGPHPVYFQYLFDAFGPSFPWHNWSYPPHYLLFVWPLGFFEYKAAMMLFLGTTLAFYLWSARLLAGKESTLIWIAILPFVSHNIWVAQNGFLFGGCAFAALALRDTRPILAGIFLGILTIKPQLGVLFPFLLLAERRWLVIASACVSTVALVLLSAAVFGVDSWRGYLTEVVPYQAFVMRELGGTFLAMLASAYGMFRNWGAEADLALPLHTIIAIPVAIAAIGALFLARRDEDRTILLLIATFIITPYALTYDLGMLAGALGLLAARPVAQIKRNGLLIALTMMLPVVMMPLGEAGASIAPALIIAVFVLAIQESGVLERAKAVWKATISRERASPAAASD